MRRSGFTEKPQVVLCRSPRVAEFSPLTLMEILAAILFFSNLALSATAAILAVVLFRHYRHCGWLLLAVAFLWPFGSMLLRLLHHMRLLTYRSYGPVVDGLPQLTYHLQIPGFYLVVVAALVLLIRDAKRDKKI